MRILRGIAIAVLLIANAPCDAVVIYPWCTTGAGHDFGGINCGFNTFEQCLQTARGNGQHCQPNPLYQPSPKPSKPHKRN
jgi:Protein of unknown function (DUF3551)